jgi:hypothetical protein
MSDFSLKQPDPRSSAPDGRSKRWMLEPAARVWIAIAMIVVAAPSFSLAGPREQSAWNLIKRIIQFGSTAVSAKQIVEEFTPPEASDALLISVQDEGFFRKGSRINLTNKTSKTVFAIQIVVIRPTGEESLPFFDLPGFATTKTKFLARIEPGVQVRISAAGHRPTFYTHSDLMIVGQP